MIDSYFTAIKHKLLKTAPLIGSFDDFQGCLNSSANKRNLIIKTDQPGSRYLKWASGKIKWTV